MVGAIVLTLRHRSDVKRQNVLAQMYRDPATAMEATARACRSSSWALNEATSTTG